VYRDDPLPDEEELREVIGDDHVDRLRNGGADALAAAVDALRVLQGWVSDADAAAWMTTSQRRLGGAAPLDALVWGRRDEVLDAARAWAGAQG